MLPAAKLIHFLLQSILTNKVNKKVKQFNIVEKHLFSPFSGNLRMESYYNM